MPYRFAVQDQDYSDFSAGRILYSLPGAPAFPVRLAREVFERALHLQKIAAPLALYDPTCGGAYHLTALGFLYREQICSISASDADPVILELARRNLGLLLPDGLSQREQEIRRMLHDFGKESHADALHSLARLVEKTAAAPPAVRVFEANVFDPSALRDGLQGAAPDLVFSDVPYGNMSAWQAAQEETANAPAAVWRMLDSLLAVLTPRSLVAIAADKNQKIAHPGYRRADRFQVGKRQVVFLRPTADKT